MKVTLEKSSITFRDYFTIFDALSTVFEKQKKTKVRGWGEADVQSVHTPWCSFKKKIGPHESALSSPPLGFSLQLRNSEN